MDANEVARAAMTTMIVRPVVRQITRHISKKFVPRKQKEILAKMERLPDEAGHPGRSSFDLTTKLNGRNITVNITMTEVPSTWTIQCDVDKLESQGVPHSHIAACIEMSKLLINAVVPIMNNVVRENPTFFDDAFSAGWKPTMLNVNPDGTVKFDGLKTVYGVRLMHVE